MGEQRKSSSKIPGKINWRKWRGNFMAFLLVIHMISSLCLAASPAEEGFIRNREAGVAADDAADDQDSGTMDAADAWDSGTMDAADAWDSGTMTADGPDTWASSFYEGMTWEEMYTARHLEFLKSADYQDLVVFVEGGLAACLKTNYENAHLQYVNGAWSSFDSTVRYLFDGDVTGEVEQLVHLTSEYDILVAELMGRTVNTAYSAFLLENYYSAWDEFLQEIQTWAENTKEAMNLISMDPDGGSSVLDNLDDLLFIIDNVRVCMKTVDFANSNSSKLFTEQFAILQEKLDSTFALGQIQEFAMNLRILSDVATAATDTVSETIGKYCFLKAVSSATEEWTSAWEELATLAFDAGTDEGEAIGTSIWTLLSQIESAQESMMATVLETAADSAKSNIAAVVLEEGVDFVWHSLDTIPVLHAVHIGMSWGVKLADAVTGMDSIAYYGNMMCDVGEFAGLMYDTLLEYASRLESTPTFENAKQFHEWYHIYREVQIYACDTAIDYATALSSGIRNAGAMKYITDAHIAEAVSVLSVKAAWLEAECHESSVSEIREALESFGYTDVQLTEEGGAYAYTVSAAELGKTVFTVTANADTGFVTAYYQVDAAEGPQGPLEENNFVQVIGNVWNWKRCEKEEGTDDLVFTEVFEPLTEEEIEQALTELGYVTWQYFGEDDPNKFRMVITYVNTYLDRDLSLDEVSGIAAVAYDGLLYGFVDLHSCQILSGNPTPKKAEEEPAEPEALPGGRMTREEAEAALAAFLGDAALTDYSVVNDSTDGFLYFRDPLLNMSVEVNLDTGVLTQTNYRGIILDTYTFTR